MDANKMAEDFLLWNSLKLAPYDPKINTPQDVGLGGPSTEYTATVDTPQGTYKNIPQLWWKKNGQPLLVPEDTARGLASLTERVTGRSFPEYQTPEEADLEASMRSKAGGAEKQSLMDYADEIKRYGPRY
ncbi:hypothetical protein PP747_gp047 [Rhizobium phage RHph_Y38]|uniref:Uncharacterized protein n=2 Tax=Acanvirus TaxID=3044653 RepID=A0A7S5UU46_9CAUD|nr:hypothetical protein PP747_gp047 [Rhizobium phage RHph_Y38]YP_010658255.1 hypothetical protein PP749_gp044 [Rhizobium phage RHEph22]QIG67748.1 hypothetical protein EVB52_047 [Rhizobium phage RHph_Y38]QXV74717.1 hypothetical protein [Rhizobium phage RHEph22]QXV74812.1 hypothetical protein [Rhizobium phage RHEph24]